MLTAKQEVMELLKGLPDTSTLEEIQYHLYVRQKVQRGIQDVEEGRTYTQEEVEILISQNAMSKTGQKRIDEEVMVHGLFFKKAMKR